MFKSQLMQMPDPGTSSFIGPAPRHFAKPWGWAKHFGAKAPGCLEGEDGNRQIDICVSYSQIQITQHLCRLINMLYHQPGAVFNIQYRPFVT